jgi:hypothetical protein
MSDAPRPATPDPQDGRPAGTGAAQGGATESTRESGSAAGAAPDGPRPAAPVRRLTDADADGGTGITRSRPFAENLGIVVAAFVLGTVVAEVAGAANLGTALSFGQIAFAIALVFVLVRR